MPITQTRLLTLVQAAENYQRLYADLTTAINEAYRQAKAEAAAKPGEAQARIWSEAYYNIMTQAVAPLDTAAREIILREQIHLKHNFRENERQRINQANRRARDRAESGQGYGKPIPPKAALPQVHGLGPSEQSYAQALAMPFHPVPNKPPSFDTKTYMDLERAKAEVEAEEQERLARGEKPATSYEEMRAKSEARAAREREEARSGEAKTQGATRERLGVTEPAPPTLAAMRQAEDDDLEDQAQALEALFNEHGAKPSNET